MTGISLTRLVPELFRLLTNEGRKAFRGLLRLSAVVGVLDGLSMLAVLAGVTALADGETAFGLGVGAWVAVLAVLAIVGFAVSYVVAEASYRSAMDVMRNVHKVVGDKLATLPLGWYSGVEAGRYSRALTSGMMEMGQSMAHMIGKAVTLTVQIVGLAIGLWFWQPALGLAFSIAVPSYLVIIWVVTKVLTSVAARAHHAKDELATRMIEFATVQPALRSAGRSANPLHLSATVASENSVARKALAAETGLIFVLSMSSQIIAVVLILVAGGLAVDGTLDPLSTVAFIGLCLRLSALLSGLGESAIAGQILAQVLIPLGEILDEDAMPEPAVSAGAVADSSIELEAVNFGYLEGRPVLRDVSFTVPANTMTALVGPSGSGKTTVARLVSRFYDPWEGSIKVGGQVVSDLTLADLMSQVSLVFQDVYLFDDTLLANIRVGNSSATDDEVRAAAVKAGVSEIVERLPDGWATRVGEGGTRLSGGERQRVSIARALVKRAPIVIIDEATSALDAENEAQLARAFEDLRSEATVLVIAHKLNTIENADQIVVLDGDGSVAQCGTHAELSGVPGIYQRFWSKRQLAHGWRLVGSGES